MSALTYTTVQQMEFLPPAMKDTSPSQNLTIHALNRTTKLLCICRLDAPVRIIILIPPVEPTTITVNSNLYPFTPMDVKLSSNHSHLLTNGGHPSSELHLQVMFSLGHWGPHWDICQKHTLDSNSISTKDCIWLINQPGQQSCYFCSAHSEPYEQL